MGAEENDEGDMTSLSVWLGTGSDDGCSEGNFCVYGFACWGPDCPDADQMFVYPDVSISNAEYDVCTEQLIQMQETFCNEIELY